MNAQDAGEYFAEQRYDAEVYNVDVLRAKLTNQPDEYQKQLDRQNNGEPCEHCGAHFGHRGHCGLINRNAGEAKRIAEGAALPTKDEDFLKEARIKW